MRLATSLQAIVETGQQLERVMKPEQKVISRKSPFVDSLFPVKLLSLSLFCSSDLLSQS